MRWLRFIAPLLVIAIVDLLFRAGLWEPFVQPNSHAGTSIRLKEMLVHADVPIEYVTIGSSRPHYGLRHQAIGALAERHGTHHANLSMPGSHWMTVGVLGQWLDRHRPEIRGGIVALSIHDFTYAYNGDYEIAIVAPFQGLGSTGTVVEHIRPKPDRLASYGALSALFAYRDDIRQGLAHPIQRYLSVSRANDQPGRDPYGNIDNTGHLCAPELQTLADCADLIDPDDAMTRQCRNLEKMATGRADFSRYSSDDELPDTATHTRDLIRERLRQLSWQRPVVVLLMPMHRIWENEILPLGQREWARHILAPLEADGDIVVLDYTDFFDDGDGGSDCTAFFDFYHNNVAGSERLTEALLPEIERLLHRR